MESMMIAALLLIPSTLPVRCVADGFLDRAA